MPHAWACRAGRSRRPRRPEGHNALSRHAGTITVWIDGIAVSAASYVAMAGDEIVMPENAFLMIHDPSGLVMGKAADMRDMARTLDKIGASMLHGYAARSGKPEAEIAAFLAAEALEAGLATRLWSETTRGDLRVAELPNPRPGDRIEIDGEAFLIQGEPVRDRERLVWTLELRPA